METWNLIHLVAICSVSIILFCSETCTASVRSFGKISPGFQGSQMNWIDNDGLFLLSNNSDFAFGFQTTEKDVTLFLLVVLHNRLQELSGQQIEGHLFQTLTNSCSVKTAKCIYRKGEMLFGR
ncbi:hypothetical protein Dsin_016781 [Dipteronia sinensis]|uniref:Uncharacterized protein n=1 Tax=Dipteronia sinensis TaxID=43782 RepID=A0AAE0E6C1_9ROSI|nr:hypothetical protein Dsin_016781 [Dipteronia sinensis]